MLCPSCSKVNLSDAESCDCGHRFSQVEVIEAQRRTWGALAHMTILLDFVWPYAGIVGAFAMYLFKSGEDSKLDHHLKAAANFQMLVAGGFVIVGLASSLLTIKATSVSSSTDLYLHSYPSAITAILLSMIGSSAGWLLFLFCSLFAMRGALASKNGRSYQYPIRSERLSIA